MKRLRGGIIDYAKRYLPRDIRSKVLTKSFMNAKHTDTLNKAIDKIDTWAKENRKKILIVTNSLIIV